jgi:ABC-type Zn uptake system ZnuABC Zn-binding protein ZnuA
MKKIFLILVIIMQFSTGYAQDIIVSSYPVKLILQELTGISVDIRPIIPFGANPYADSVRNPVLERGAKLADALIYISDEYEPWIKDIDAQKKIALFDMLPPEMILDENGFPAFDKKQLEKLRLNLEKNYQSKRPKPRKEIIHKYLNDKKLNPYFWTDPVAINTIMPELTDSLISILPLEAPKFAKNLGRFDSRVKGVNLKLRRIIQRTKYKSFYQLSHRFDYFIKRYKLFNVGAYAEKASDFDFTETKLFRYPTDEKIDSLGLKNIENEYQKNNSPVVYISDVDNLEKYNSIKRIVLNLYHSDSEKKRYFDYLLDNARKINSAYKYKR